MHLRGHFEYRPFPWLYCKFTSSTSSPATFAPPDLLPCLAPLSSPTGRVSIVIMLLVLLHFCLCVITVSMGYYYISPPV